MILSKLSYVNPLMKTIYMAVMRAVFLLFVRQTVILQKHVNKTSLIYMEPSRESPFQSDASVERICLPRAKLANGHVQR